MYIYIYIASVLRQMRATLLGLRMKCVCVCVYVCVCVCVWDYLGVITSRYAPSLHPCTLSQPTSIYTLPAYIHIHSPSLHPYTLSQPTSIYTLPAYIHTHYLGVDVKVCAVRCRESANKFFDICRNIITDTQTHRHTGTQAHTHTDTLG